MLAHRDTGLACADDQRVCLFNGHLCPPCFWAHSVAQALRQSQTILAQVKVVDLNAWIGNIQSKVRGSGGV
jgi:hypothetical protein